MIIDNFIAILEIIQPVSNYFNYLADCYYYYSNIVSLYFSISNLIDYLIVDYFYFVFIHLWLLKVNK